MTVMAWPSALAPKGISFTRRGMTIAGPPSLSGRSQVAQYDSGYWMATLQRMPVGGRDNVLAYRRLFAAQEGGAHQILVPVFDRANAPWPTPGVYGAQTDFTDGTKFSDGTYFADWAINVTLASGAALRATDITVTQTSVATIVGGEYFSIGNHLYIITDVIASGHWRIWPPLRAAADSGVSLNFDNPACLMRLVNEGDDDLSLEMGRYGFPDLNFIEDLST